MIGGSPSSSLHAPRGAKRLENEKRSLVQDRFASRETNGIEQRLRTVAADDDGSRPVS
jgi:hypothetical protein